MTLHLSPNFFMIMALWLGPSVGAAIGAWMARKNNKDYLDHVAKTFEKSLDPLHKALGELQLGIHEDD